MQLTNLVQLKLQVHIGYNSLFFQSYWNIVGQEVTNAALAFFSIGYLPNSISCTNIVLIPKLLGPKELSQFRPINLCNFIYKVISKVLVNGYKFVLPIVISC